MSCASSNPRMQAEERSRSLLSNNLAWSPSVRNFVWPLAKRQKDLAGHYGSLHAKCAVVDGECLFLSSANLTEFAFNLNMELGVLIKGGSLPSAVETHFHTLIATECLERIVGGELERIESIESMHPRREWREYWSKCDSGPKALVTHRLLMCVYGGRKQGAA